MKWKDVTKTHNGMRAIVWSDSTPDHPERGEGPYLGIIRCTEEIPTFQSSRHLHSFAWWWDVQLIDQPTPKEGLFTDSQLRSLIVGIRISHRPVDAAMDQMGGADNKVCAGHGMGYPPPYPCQVIILCDALEPRLK